MKKYDFEAGDPVLVRCSDNDKWRYNIFSHSDENNETHPYRVINDIGYKQCLPYKRYEYLINTNNRPFEYGDLVKVSSKGGAYMLCIWPDKIPSGVDNNFFNVANVNLAGEYSSSCGFHKDDKIELASKSNIKEFNNVLNKAGFYWNGKILMGIKDGDFIRIRSSYNTWISIFNKSEGELTYTYCDLCVGGHCKDISHFNVDSKLLTAETRDIRLANQEEINTFLNAMHQEGKDWDSVNKQVVDYKWKPEYGTYYYFLTSFLKVSRLCWYNTSTDNNLWEAGNCFKTEEEVLEIIKMIKNKG